jgi:hypothetical protein
MRASFFESDVDENDDERLLLFVSFEPEEEGK